MLKVRSLGSFTSAARGILVTSGTNATPIVLTVTAGHGMKNDDRLALAGITTLTAANGEFSLDAVGATAATLRGSVGNGAFGGTAIAAVICDKTPFNKNHSSLVMIGNTPGQAVFVGTVVIESADSIDATQFYYTNTSGVATAGFADCVQSGEAAIPAASAGIGWELEVTLKRYMTARCSAYTSGGANVRMAA